MTYYMWRLSEAGPNNLGLACTDDGLLLGRTPLIERRDGSFVVREQHDIERLLQRAYQHAGSAERLMTGLVTVAHALNANDHCWRESQPCTSRSQTYQTPPRANAWR